MSSIKNKTNLKIILILLSIAFILPMVMADSLNNANINTSSGNINITIGSTPIYFTSLIVNSNNVTFNQLRSSESSLEYLTFTITSSQNIQSNGIPLINNIDMNTRTINSGMVSQDVILTLGTLDCTLVNEVDFNGVRLTTGYFGNLCNQLKTTGYTVTLNNGINTIKIVYGTNTLSSSILRILIVILGVCIVLGTISYAYISAKNNFSELSYQEFTKYAITVLIVLILEIGLTSYIASIIGS